jgi:hypothetical protein
MWGRSLAISGCGEDSQSVATQQAARQAALDAAQAGSLEGQLSIRQTQAAGVPTRQTQAAGAPAITPTPDLVRPSGSALINLQSITEDQLVACISFLGFAATSHNHQDSGELQFWGTKPNSFGRWNVMDAIGDSCGPFLDIQLVQYLEQVYSGPNTFNARRLSDVIGR